MQPGATKLLLDTSLATPKAPTETISSAVAVPVLVVILFINTSRAAANGLSLVTGCTWVSP